MSSGFKIKLVNVRVKDGKIVPTTKHLSVSAQIAKRSSKRVRVKRP